MSRRPWARLDNASNIFLAARSDVDPKVFRMSAEVEHDVDPELLQRALDETFDRYPLYRAVLRRGVFWYYLQDSDLRPVVTPETTHTCAPIYRADDRNLLFRVIHHRRRINLEVFHALSDGTGALWFLTDLLGAYMRLRFPEERGLEEAGRARVVPLDPGQPVTTQPREPGDADLQADEPEVGKTLTTDSFAHYFRRRKGERRTRDTDGTRGLGRFVGAPTKRVHTVKGTRTPDNRTRVVELTVPAADALALAKAEGVSLTMYLAGLFFSSIRATGDGGSETVALSVPVNLRQFFPSTSARNFFTTVRVEHTFGKGDDDLGSVCRNLDAQFRPQTTPEALDARLRRFIRFERMIALRIVPRPIKDVVLGMLNRASNRGLTLAISNLGNVRLPEPVDARVGRMLFHVSAVRPQFCAMSHRGQLTISFTSPFTETDHVREFARHLSGAGVPVTVAAARVSEDELAFAEASP